MIGSFVRCLMILSITVNFSPMLFASSDITLTPITVDVRDEAALQRGAGVFMHYCLGCHSLQYERYQTLAKGIGLLDLEGHVREDLVKTHLNLVSEQLHDPIRSSIPKQDAEQWFGVAPPDLTLVARVRGVDWLYAYLMGFYADPTRPLGVNNVVFPEVGMPHVLLPLQGIQVPRNTNEKPHHVSDLVLTEPGTLNPQAYEQLVRDVVTFLAYTAEPIRAERERIGVWVLLFLVIFLVFSYLLKREYWKSVR